MASSRTAAGGWNERVGRKARRQGLELVGPSWPSWRLWLWLCVRRGSWRFWAEKWHDLISVFVGSRGGLSTETGGKLESLKRWAVGTCERPDSMPFASWWRRKPGRQPAGRWGRRHWKVEKRRFEVNGLGGWKTEWRRVGGMRIAMATVPWLSVTWVKDQLYKIVSEIIFRFSFGWRLLQPSVALGWFSLPVLVHFDSRGLGLRTKILIYKDW